MNDNMYSPQNKEIEVNLVDAMFYLLMHWKSLLIAIVIGVLLGTGIYMIKKPKETAEPISESIEEVEEKYDLDADVKENMELAYRYRKLYTSQLKYNKSSIFMQLDPNSIYAGMLEFYISADNNTRLLGEFFQNILNDEDFLKEVKKAGDFDCDLQYIKEILSCSLSQNTYPIISTLGRSDRQDDIVISYSILYMDKGTCRKVLNVISAWVTELDEKLKEEYGEYEFVKTNDTVQLSVSSDVLNRQKGSVDLLNTYLSNATKLESSFGEKDLEYYETVYLSREIEDEEVEELNSPIQEFSKTDIIKWLVLGILLSCVCWGVYYFVKYLFDIHVKGVWEFSGAQGIQLLGRIELIEKQEKGISGCISRMNRKRKGSSDTIEYITTLLKSMNLGKTVLCFNPDIEELQLFSEKFVKLNGDIIVGNVLFQNSDTLEKAKQSDGVILAVAVGKTTQEEVRRNLEICKLQKIPVIGAIVVDKNYL